MPELTDRERAIYAACWSHADRHGHRPTLRQLAEDLNLSAHSTAQWCILSIQAKGYDLPPTKWQYNRRQQDQQVF